MNNTLRSVLKEERRQSTNTLTSLDLVSLEGTNRYNTVYNGHRDV